MKGIQDIYSDATRQLVEAFNAKLAAAESERGAIKAERQAIVDDAVAGATPAVKLAKAIEALRVRSVQADMDELVAHNDLPAMNEGHKTDFAVEETRARKAVEDRVVILERHADELVLTKPLRHALILADVERRDEEAKAHGAMYQSAKGLVTADDTARILELKDGIVRALTR